MENENAQDWGTTEEEDEEDVSGGLTSRGESEAHSFGEEHQVGVFYPDVVKKHPVVRQSYVEGHQGELGAAVAACYHWKQQVDACLQTKAPANCGGLQLKLTICVGERIAPLQFEQLRGCLANSNNIGRCEAQLLELADQINHKAQQDQRPERSGLTAWERQQLAECGSGSSTRQSEIDCMIPRVCGQQHEALQRCVVQQRQRSPSTTSTIGIVGGQCLGPAKQALHCWGAFNRRREHTEMARGQL